MRDERLTKFTCCGAVAPPKTETCGFAERILGRGCSEDRDPKTGRGPTRQKIADKAQAGRLFCALPRVAPPTF
jgi:hypothetical protein